MGIVQEEAEESIYWMALLIDCGLIQKDDISHLLKDANQILAMTVSSIKMARRKNNDRFSELFSCLLFFIPQSASRTPHCGYHSRSTIPFSRAKVVRAWIL